MLCNGIVNRAGVINVFEIVGSKHIVPVDDPRYVQRDENGTCDKSDVRQVVHAPERTRLLSGIERVEVMGAERHWVAFPHIVEPIIAATPSRIIVKGKRRRPRQGSTPEHTKRQTRVTRAKPVRFIVLPTLPVSRHDPNLSQNTGHQVKITLCKHTRCDRACYAPAVGPSHELRQEAVEGSCRLAFEIELAGTYIRCR